MTRMLDSVPAIGSGLLTRQAVHDITVLMGGPSAEREVSLSSGRAVADALMSLGRRVIESDISPSDLSALDQDADMVFIALHGTFGEDGQLQDILEQRGIPFSGSGAAASRLAMDKVAAKRRFIESGVPTPRFDVARRGREDYMLTCWSLPVVAKPISQGSSVDTYIIRDAYGFQAIISKLIAKYGACLIEEFIDGHELTVGVLGDRALPVCKIETPRGFYDYAAKYLDDQTRYLFDFDLPADLLRRVQDLSLQAHRCLGCRDFSRVDWRVDAQTLEPYALEVNTIPGFTDHSLLPKSAARIGMSFERLCQAIVDMTMARA